MPYLLRTFALSYAQRGLPVLPLVPRDKQPLTPHGFHDASTEADAIHAWWEKWPDANIGIRTGREAGVVVLDVDGPDGEASLTTLAGDLPPTWVVLTGKGSHFYFLHPGDDRPNSVRKLGAGLDVRGDGGYVAAPPSVHPSGAIYTWVGERRQLAPWPSWLRPPEPKPMPQPSASTVGSPHSYALAGLVAEAKTVRFASEGTRNDTLNTATYKVSRFITSGQLSASVVVSELLGAATAAGLSEIEARRTIASALQARARSDGRPA